MLKPPNLNRKIKSQKKAPVSGQWAVLIFAGNLLLVSDYATSAVERLKLIVPPGARRFQRSVSNDFFASYGLNPAQSEWLTESKLFSGSWQLLPDYKRPILEALTLEYPEVWYIEGEVSERLAARSSDLQLPIDPIRFGLAENVHTPLTWAKSYALYCHRHRLFEVDPCKDAGVLFEIPKVEPAVSSSNSNSKISSSEDFSKSIKTKDGHKASFLLKAPRHTLIRARRKQTSYYLADEQSIIRLGRDEEGASVSEIVIESQRLALVLRASRSMHSVDTQGFE